MLRLRQTAVRWGPPLVWMGAIFFSSATPSSNLPNFGLVDTLIKKTGHFLGYAILALLYRRALGADRPAWPAWILAVLYALLDEFHQSFVPGRHPSLVDVFLFDGGGAACALWAFMFFRRGSRAER